MLKRVSKISSSLQLLKQNLKSVHLSATRRNASSSASKLICIHLGKHELTTDNSSTTFPVSKYTLIPQTLIDTKVIDEGDILMNNPSPISRTRLTHVHAPGYVDAFLSNTLTDRQVAKLGMGPITDVLKNRSLRIVGATTEAAFIALWNGSCAVLAGGQHHAHHDYGSGFCIFNDIVVAAETLVREVTSQVKRYIVVDLDVHQGDGTATLCAGKDHAFTFSMHGKNNFPKQKPQSCLDVELDDKTGDTEYLSKLQQCLDFEIPNRLKDRVDILFYQAGVDCMKGDANGRLALTMEGLAKRDEMVFNFANKHGLPVVVNMGGGYPSRTITMQDVVNAHCQTVNQMKRIINKR